MDFHFDKSFVVMTFVTGVLTINNYNVVETGGVIDFTLILGNHVDSYLYGLLSVTNGWYRGSLTKLVLF